MYAESRNRTGGRKTFINGTPSITGHGMAVILELKYFK